MRSGLVVALFMIAVGAPACGDESTTTPPQLPGGSGPVKAHSSSILLNAAGNELYVVNPDADSVSVIDVTARTLKREIPLADTPPATDAAGNYVPLVMPRAAALAPDGTTLYVTGERSG